MQEKHTDWLTFVAQYRDGSFDHFAVDPFTLLSDNYIACDDARERQKEGAAEIVRYDAIWGPHMRLSQCSLVLNTAAPDRDD